MKEIRIVLVGPRLNNGLGSYGGGIGGVVSAVMRMVHRFEEGGIKYLYIDYSVRRISRFWLLFLPIRLSRDILTFALKLYPNRQGVLLHIIADAGLAVFRTLLYVALSRALRVPLICDARGNALEKVARNEENLLHLVAWNLILRLSSKTLVQSKEQALVLNKRFLGKVIYQPNWIKVDVNRSRTRGVLSSDVLHVVFVGYCYYGKGVFDAVNGCIEAAKRGLSIRLTFIGEEEISFASYCLHLPAHPGLEIHRLGKLTKDKTLDYLFEADALLFPSYHAGEGHPNVINEAMYAQLVIITTRVGVIGEFLNEENAFFVEPRNPADIAAKLLTLNSNRDVGVQKGINAHREVITNFSEEVVVKELFNIYEKLLSQCAA
jgi:glycosyltransferase involved in cell wall biosynthesis